MKNVVLIFEMGTSEIRVVCTYNGDSVTQYLLNIFKVKTLFPKDTLRHLFNRCSLLIHLNCIRHVYP